MASEYWRINQRFPSYEICSDGRVRRGKLWQNSNKDGSIKVGPYGNHGYRRVSLCEENKKYSVLLHRLIAETFLGPCPDGYVVNHRNADKANNGIDNLEYVTPADNVIHAKRLGLYRAPNKGKKTGIVPRSAFKPGNVPWNRIAELSK